MLSLLAALLLAILPACPTEDSTWCGWDATQGNGKGTSFVTLTEDFTLYL